METLRNIFLTTRFWIEVVGFLDKISAPLRDGLTGDVIIAALGPPPGICARQTLCDVYLIVMFTKLRRRHRLGIIKPLAPGAGACAR